MLVVKAYSVLNVLVTEISCVVEGGHAHLVFREHATLEDGSFVDVLDLIDTAVSHARRHALEGDVGETDDCCQ